MVSSPSSDAIDFVCRDALSTDLSRSSISTSVAKDLLHDLDGTVTFRRPGV